MWRKDLLTAGQQEKHSGLSSPARPGPGPPPPCPQRLTLVTVAPSKARAALPLQRCHRSVGHSVRGSDQGPVTDTRAVSGQCRHRPPPQTQLLQSRPRPGLWGLPSQWVLWPWASVLPSLCQVYLKVPSSSVFLKAHRCGHLWWKGVLHADG